jgi:hypothetical protein
MVSERFDAGESRFPLVFIRWNKGSIQMATKVRQAARLDRNTLRATLKAGVRYDERAKVYVGYAPSLNIYCQATTEGHARRALEGAIMLFLGVARNGRGFAGVLAMAGLAKDPRKNGAVRKDDRIHATEEEILEQQNFHCIFDVPTSFPQGGRLA